MVGTTTDDADGPNVLLFVIDTLRADRLGSYGYGRPTSPNFDALAADGALFEHATAQSPWTMPSMASLWSSRHPANHRVVLSPRQLAPDLELLPERFLAEGYETVGFNENAIAGSLIGAADGFELLVENVIDEEQGDARRGAAGFLEWFEQRDESRPFFAWVHGVEPHVPYNPAPEFLFGDPPPERAAGIELNAMLLEFQALTREDLGTLEQPNEQGRRFASLREQLLVRRTEIDDLYDSCVHLADVRLGLLVEALKRTGEYENTIVVVTSDHGEELGDHGYFLHDHALIEELLHIPLAIRVPGLEPRSIRQRAQTIDLFPTLAELLDWTPDPGWEGSSLAPLLRGTDVPAELLGRDVVAGRFTSGTREPWNEARRGNLQIGTYTADGLKLVADVELGRVRVGVSPGPEPVPPAGSGLPAERYTAAAEAQQRWILERRDVDLGLWIEAEYTNSQRAAMEALGYIVSDPPK